MLTLLKVVHFASLVALASAQGLAGYVPDTEVEPHSLIDLDLKSIEECFA